MFKRILIPVDGSSLSKKAARTGVALAKRLGAEVVAMMATPTFRVFTLNPLMATDSSAEYVRDSKKIAAKALAEVGKIAAAAKVRCGAKHIVSDHPYNAIIRSAKRERCDLVVMASHGRGGVSGVLLGSETAKVLTHSGVPVLVCR